MNPGHDRSKQLPLNAARACMVALVLAFLFDFAFLPTSTVRAQSVEVSSPVPVLAYFYIWYSQGSWDRAKRDVPLLGKYSSDDAQVMWQQIQWAKQAGITGFIVSWKNTPVLTPRLEQMVKVAREEDFKLAIIYEGLDFNRNPVPASQIASDLDYFTAHWGNDPVFSIFDRPLVIWSGTWNFSTLDVRSVTSTRRSQLLILASARTDSDYQRLAPYMDGDAYYWSSVNPSTYPGYAGKLASMSDVVHQNGGLWIAPAAPGFDARDIGGTTVVDRKNGETLNSEFEAASTSSPDAIGLISWNEFSENSYIEPSRDYGDTYLTKIAQLIKVQSPTSADFNSDAPDQPSSSARHSLSLLVMFGTLMLGAMAVVVVRAVRNSWSAWP